MNMQNTGFETSAPILSVEATEEQVFRDLEAGQKAAREREAESTILFQYPDNRTVFQRLRAWWYVRQLQAEANNEITSAAPVAEPVWPRLCAKTKYL